MTRVPAIALAAALSLLPLSLAQGQAAPPVGEVSVLHAGRPLTPAEIEDLENGGTRVLRPMGSGRYLVRSEGTLSASAARSTMALRSIEPADRRVGVSQALLSSGGRAILDVHFYDDVPFDVARDAVLAAGGELVDPLQTSLGLTRTISAVLDRDAVDALTSGNLAQLVRDRPRHLQSNNATAATLSKVDVARDVYGLTGEGVTVSVYEISPLQADHPEFEGRATGPGGTPEPHATHVAGTVAAAGIIQSGARGMAPKARIAGHVVDLSFVDRKAESFLVDRPVSDNNSWSFVVGWNYDSARSLNWEWYGFAEEFGAYSPETAALDELARARQTLMVYSSGNDNTDSGPTIAPFAHYHGSKDEVWCVSSNGSGSDCPASPCGTRCESSGHPADGPWTTMSLTANLKNGVAVGAVNANGQIASFSSRGPARDGRVKPEVVAKGVSQFSLNRNSGYTSMQGTSMAAPVVSGIAALLAQQWERTFGGAPRAETLRGLIIHGADDLGPAGPDYTYGFGLVNAQASASVIAEDMGSARRLRTGVVAQNDRWSVPVNFTAGDQIRLTLVWHDTPNVAYTTPALVNDLDLALVAPDGRTIRPWTLDPASPETPAVRGINRVDNAERIDWTADVTGAWRIEVDGGGVSTPQAQAFVLLSSLEMGRARLACEDAFEPNETEATAVGEFPDRQAIRASVCGASDRDFYRFTVRRSGPVTATVTSEVPVRVTLRSGGSVLGSVDVAAGGTRELSVNLGGAPGQVIDPTTVILSIEPIGDVEGEYVVTTTRPDVPVNRGRGIRR